MIEQLISGVTSPLFKWATIAGVAVFVLIYVSRRWRKGVTATDDLEELEDLVRKDAHARDEIREATDAARDHFDDAFVPVDGEAGDRDDSRPRKRLSDRE